MVEYINSKGHAKVISNSVTKKGEIKLHYEEKGAIEDILSFCKKNHYNVPYMRINDYPDYWEFDVGSHTEFFKLHKEPGNEEI